MLSARAASRTGATWQRWIGRVSNPSPAWNVRPASRAIENRQLDLVPSLIPQKPLTHHFSHVLTKKGALFGVGGDPGRGAGPDKASVFAKLRIHQTLETNLKKMGLVEMMSRVSHHVNAS